MVLVLQRAGAGTQGRDGRSPGNAEVFGPLGAAPGRAVFGIAWPERRGCGGGGAYRGAGGQGRRRAQGGRRGAEKHSTKVSDPTLLRHPVCSGWVRFTPRPSASMRYRAVATDYDGTRAHDGRVKESTLAALERLLGTGRKLILVTGRELGDLLSIFPEVHLFAWVVAENGALLYRPSTKEER